MGIKKNEKTGLYDVSYHKRHPVTKIPFRAARIGIKTEAQARRLLNELVLQVEDKLREEVIPRWSAVVSEYYDRCLTERTRKTAENYKKCIEHHTAVAWGDRFVDSITSDEIRKLLKDRVGDKSMSHQRNVLHFIRATFNLAYEKGILIKNPTPEMKFRMGDKIKKCLTEEQVRTLLNKSKEYDWEWYPHVAMALYTGMRNGELYALTWDKVNLDKRTILVDSSWNNVDGFKCTKSGDDRMLEIAPTLVHMLKELKLQSSDRSFVLPRMSDWDQGKQAAALRTFCMGLGLPLIRFHDLRATWATIMLSNGVEPAKVMMMGGWKDMKTLMVYLRKAGISIRGITNGLNLHDPSHQEAKVVDLFGGSQS